MKQENTTLLMTLGVYPLQSMNEAPAASQFKLNQFYSNLIQYPAPF